MPQTSGVEQDRLRAILPEGFISLRPVLRINGEIRGDAAAHGKSIGKTLMAVPTAVENTYPKQSFTPENAADIPCDQVLGTYVVRFDREEEA